MKLFASILSFCILLAAIEVCSFSEWPYSKIRVSAKSIKVTFNSSFHPERILALSINKDRRINIRSQWHWLRVNFASARYSAGPKWRLKQMIKVLHWLLWTERYRIRINKNCLMYEHKSNVVFKIYWHMPKPLSIEMNLAGRTRLCHPTHFASVYFPYKILTLWAWVS